MLKTKKPQPQTHNSNNKPEPKKYKPVISISELNIKLRAGELTPNELRMIAKSYTYYADSPYSNDDEREERGQYAMSAVILYIGLRDNNYTFPPGEFISISIAIETEKKYIAWKKSK
jgi:hypothetical protein